MSNSAEVNTVLAQAAVKLAANTVIDSHETCEAASDNRKSINDLRITIDKQRKVDKQPFLDAGKLVDQIAKSMTDPLKAAVVGLDDKLRVYAQKIESLRVQADEMEASNVAVAEADALTEGLPLDLSDTSVEAPTPAPIRTRKSLDLDVYDESLIPREYLIVDTAKIRKDLAAGKTIAGARMIQTQHMA